MKVLNTAVSIVDVARQAGVSPATVSRVLNGRGRPSVRVRRQVEKAARELQYSIRPVGRPTSSRQTRQLGILYAPRMVVEGAATQAVRENIKGFQQVLRDTDHYVSVMAGAEHVSKDVMLRHMVEDGEPDGLAFIGALPDDGYSAWLTEKKLPLVYLNDQPRPHDFSFSHVCVDYVRGVALAGEHLYALGHRRFGLMAAANNTWPQHGLARGVELFLERHGLEPAVRYALPDDFNQARHQEAAQLMLDQGVTAIITGDYVVAHMYEAFRQRGLRVPQDISMTGFDNLGLVAGDGVKITSIDYDKRRMGRLAARMLLQLLDEGERLSQLSATVGVQLVHGQTTAHCRALS